MASAKRPSLLVLDEPVASLDPLARGEFLRSLKEIVIEHGVSVVLSSHLVADLERVCDYLVVLVASRVQVAGEIEGLLASHHLITGKDADKRRLPPHAQVIEIGGKGDDRRILIHSEDPVLDPASTARPPNLEDLVLAYMGRATPGEDRDSPFSGVRP
jgi:ABC-2 type transport system ATP-binding protein